MSIIFTQWKGIVIMIAMLIILANFILLMGFLFGGWIKVAGLAMFAVIIIIAAVVAYWQYKSQ